jgi:hypothetical protein
MMSTLSMSELRRLADAADVRDVDRLRGDLVDLLAHHELLDVLTREYLTEILSGSYRRFGPPDPLDATA